MSPRRGDVAGQKAESEACDPGLWLFPTSWRRLPHCCRSSGLHGGRLLVSPGSSASRLCARLEAAEAGNLISCVVLTAPEKISLGPPAPQAPPGQGRYVEG